MAYERVEKEKKKEKEEKWKGQVQSSALLKVALVHCSLAPVAGRLQLALRTDFGKALAVFVIGSRLRA